MISTYLTYNKITSVNTTPLLRAKFTLCGH